MTDEDFEDLMLAGKSCVIQGFNEAKVRAHFSARGVAPADLERLVATLDFSSQRAQAGRHWRYRGIGVLALMLGVGCELYSFLATKGSLIVIGPALGFIVIGLWLVAMGEHGKFWR